MARDAVVAIFNNRNDAYDAARDLNRLPESDAVVHKGAIVLKSPVGDVTATDTAGLGEVPAVPGGILVGALIVAEIDEGSTRPVDDAVRRYDGEVIRKVVREF